MSYYKSDGLLTEAGTPASFAGLEDCSFKDIADPYCCTLDLWTSRHGHGQLKDTLTPILRGIDPMFKFVSIQEHQCSRPPVYNPGTDSPAGKSTTPGAHGYLAMSSTPTRDGLKKQLTTPSLAVVLFLREQGPLSADNIQQKLQTRPWVFHHKIELSNVRRMPSVGCMAQQMYYSLQQSEKDNKQSIFPLWSVNSVHYGNEHLRFTIFTRNHDNMVDFYRTVSGKEVECKKTNFALFELYSQPGLDIQLGLKHSPSLQPRPTTTAFLHFKVKSLRNIAPLLYHPCTALSRGVYLTQDPDGNSVILEEQFKGQGVLKSQGRQRAVSGRTSASSVSASFYSNSNYGNRSRRSSQDSGHFSPGAGFGQETAIVSSNLTNNESQNVDEIIV